KILGRDRASPVAAKSVGIEASLAKNVSRAYDSILDVRTGFAFEAQRIFEVEGNHRGLGVLEHEVTKGANRNLIRYRGALRLAELFVTGVDFFSGGSNQGIKEVIRLDAKTFAAGNLDVGASFVFIREFVAEFRGAAGRESDHFVREMSVVVGLLLVAKLAQRLKDRVLGFGLARVNDVVDLADLDEMRMIGLSIGG